MGKRVFEFMFRGGKVGEVVAESKAEALAMARAMAGKALALIEGSVRVKPGGGGYAGAVAFAA